MIDPKMKNLYRLSYFQGLFYLVTGIWPLVHMKSFLFVTGPKTDLWLVNTVGVMIAATGLVLIFAHRNREINGAIAGLAILDALGLAGIDLFYSLARTISYIYLLDAVVEITLIVFWIFNLRHLKQTLP